VCCVEVVCAISVRACVRHSRNKDLVIRHSVVFNDSNRSALSLFPSLCCLPVRCSCACARARVCVCVCVCVHTRHAYVRICIYEQKRNNCLFRVAPVCHVAIDHQPLTALEQWKASRHRLL